MFESYLSIVNAVMVSTEAFAENSQTKEWSTHIVVSNGYFPDPFHIIYVSNGRPARRKLNKINKTSTLW